MLVRDSGLFQKFFRAESDSKMWFECITHNVMHYSSSYVSLGDSRMKKQREVDMCALDEMMFRASWRYRVLRPNVTEELHEIQSLGR
jgi:hypothetical protein